MDIVFKDTVTAELQYVDGDEERIVDKARCSTAYNPDHLTTEQMEARNKGLLRSLVRERHGSPFEAVKMSWMIEAPIFVAREAVRHRISSWNEESGRYIELRPIFYVPGPERHLRKVEGSKQMAYQTEPGSPIQQDLVQMAVMTNSRESWDLYQQMLGAGVLKEVARIVLPLSICTHWSHEMNLRALTNMLSLRIRHPESHIESKPQIEIQMLAEQMERDFAQHFPTVHAAWHASGRLPL
jgi:thymidylate synthase (FAD)